MVCATGWSFNTSTARESVTTPRYACPPNNDSEYALTSFTALGGVALGTTSYAMGSVYPPTIVELMYPRPSPAAPESDTSEGLKHTQLIEQQLDSLNIVKSCRANHTEYYETRPYTNYPEDKRIHSLTAGTLKGPGKFAVRPLIFAKWDESESVVLVHVGRSLCVSSHFAWCGQALC